MFTKGQRFERWPLVILADRGLTLETSAFHDGNSTSINLFEAKLTFYSVKMKLEKKL